MADGAKTMEHWRLLWRALVVAGALSLVAGRAEAAVGACCKAGSCSLATPEECAAMLGVPLDQPTCAGAVCVECCDNLGVNFDQCFEDIPLGGCKPLDPKHPPIPGGRCSNGNGNVGSCIRLSAAPAASSRSLLLLGIVLAVLGTAGVSTRLARARRR